MKTFLSKLNSFPWTPTLLVTLVIVFFSIRLIITYDGAHYLNYVAIFEGKLPISSWDIVRGPVFPSVIFLFDIFFGKTGTGILVGTFIFYLIFFIACYKVCKDLCHNYKHKSIIQNIVLVTITLNPLIMGYFHVLLTEFIAITLTLLNILLAYKWIFCATNNKKHLFFYTLYFVFSVVFCYHLKQPYIIISFVPLLVASIISIVKKHTLHNALYRIGTLILSLIALLISINVWNAILRNSGVNMDSGRDSSSMLSRQLLQAYQITYDQDQDGTTDPISTIDAVGILFNDFISNPSHIASIYISNYCGLTSICYISSDDGVNYVATLDFAGPDTFENSVIGYRPFSVYPNLFSMPDDLYNQASIYGESSDRSLLATAFSIFKTPTNILFKLSTALCLPTLIVLIIIRIKYKNHTSTTLFCLSLLLLTTASAHLILSAGVGLIIDRYAIEIFVPSMLGIFGTITYCRLSLISNHVPPSKNRIKRLDRK